MVLDGRYPRGNIIGVHVSAINMNDALEAMQLWISTRQPHYISVTAVAAVLEGHDDPDLRRIYNSSGLTTPDGIPVTKILRWQGFKNVTRVYGPDLMLAACERSLTTGWRHYFYGGSPAVVTELAKKLQIQFPGLQIAGIESPPFHPLSSAEEDDSIRRIRAAQPDIVWVGLGAPRQDKWMFNHLEQLAVPVLVGVGAAFDFLSGNKPQAPVWMQQNGLEWLFRLASEPRRLWRRYLLGNPRFLWLVFLQSIGVLKYD